MFPVVGYQAKILEWIGDKLIKQGAFKKVLFLCPSVSSYNALNHHHEKLLLPKMVAELDAGEYRSDTDAKLPAYEEIRFQEELRHGLATAAAREERLREAELYRILWRRLLRERTIDCVLMWNGYALPQQLFIDEFRNSSSNIFYLENGYEFQTFTVDESGINAKSGFSVFMNQNTFMPQREEDNHALSMNYNSTTKRLIEYLTNQISVFSLSVRGIRLRYEHSNSIAQKVRQVLYKKIDSLRMSFRLQLENKDFVFFPLQVVTDSQLLDNSTIRQDQAVWLTAEAIKRINETRSTPLYLVIKEHPRQECRDYLDRLKRSLDSNHIIFLRDGDVSYLVEQCKAIVTINSSVGYSGLKCKKPVIAFGESIYVKTGLVKSVKNEDQLYNILSKVLKGPANYYDQKELNRFIGLYQSYCYSISDNSFQRVAQYIAARLGGRP
jgi:capsule polysaccharide modification protein KpsS